MMAKMVNNLCECGCGRSKLVRQADINRGWGKFYSKSCKAKEQERRTGQYRNYLGSGVSRGKYLHYARESGGTPQFSRSGEYEGSTAYFSNED